MKKSHLAISVGAAFLHAAFVVVGIYVAINGRLTALETKMDLVWRNIGRIVQEIDDRK